MPPFCWYKDKCNLLNCKFKHPPLTIDAKYAILTKQYDELSVKNKQLESDYKILQNQPTIMEITELVAKNTKILNEISIKLEEQNISSNGQYTYIQLYNAVEEIRCILEYDSYYPKDNNDIIYAIRRQLEVLLDLNFKNI